MKKVKLDQENEHVKEFILSLAKGRDASLLELKGQPVLRIVPVHRKPIDKAKLKAAILRRRKVSRELNEDWSAVDREAWDKIQPVKEQS